VSHSYPISRGEFDDDERNVNTDEIIGNIFGRPKALERRDEQHRQLDKSTGLWYHIKKIGCQ